MALGLIDPEVQTGDVFLVDVWDQPFKGAQRVECVNQGSGYYITFLCNNRRYMATSMFNWADKRLEDGDWNYYVKITKVEDGVEEEGAEEEDRNLN